MSVRRAFVLGAVLALAVAGRAAASSPYELKTYSGWWDPVSLIADPRGNVYVLNEFLGLMKLEPDGTRTVLHFTPPVIAEGAQTSRGLRWGHDNQLWFTCNGVICHVDADKGGIIDTPASFPSDDHPGTATWWEIDRTARVVTRVEPSGRITTFPLSLPGDSAGAGPMGDDAGGAWLTFGTYLVHLTGAGAVDAFPLPVAVGAEQRLIEGLDGNLWLFDSQHLTRLSETGQLVGQAPMSGIPDGLVHGPDGNLWFTISSIEGGIGRITPSGRVTGISEKINYYDYPKDIVVAADGAIWVDAFRNPPIWRIYPLPPPTSTDPATGVDVRTATLHATINPNGGPTTASFEYGPTTAYGTRTATQDVGDGEDAVLLSASADGLAPGTTYHYRVTAVNGTRTVRGADRTFTTAPAPPDPPKPGGDDGGTVTGASVDGDGDGYPAGVDCDDRVAAVHPGAVDRPGDKVDQDCSGSSAAWGHLAPSVDARWSSQRRTTRFTRLTLGALPTKATVSLTCRGGGCSFKSYRLKTKRAVGRTDLLTRLKGSRLRRGAVVELRLAAVGQATTVIRWRIGPPTRRTTSCLAPRARKEGPCS